MSNFAIIIFLIACIGIIYSIVQLIRNAVKKQDNNKSKKILLGFIGLLIVSFVIIAVTAPDSSETTKTNKTTATDSVKDDKKLTDNDKKLLKKHYKDFNAEERTQFSQMEEKYKKMSDSEKENVKLDFERLFKERDVQVAERTKEKEEKEKAKALAEEKEKKAKAVEEAKKQEEIIKKNTKRLSAGEHIVGTHIDKGLYEITFNGSGNFAVYATDGSLLTNEVGGSDFGISKYRAIFTEGAKIKLSGMSINTKPVKSSLLPYGNVDLYSGYWVVGQDVTAGRYKASPTSGSGNFFVYRSDGAVKTNEILGGDIGTDEVIINLDDGDIINISSIKNVKLVPES